MADSADFFLSSSEGYKLEEPRACVRIRALAAPDKGRHLLVRVEPAIDGRPWGLAAEFGVVVLTARHRGDSLTEIPPDPVAVYVFRPLVQDPASLEAVKSEELQLLGWAEIYATREEAERTAIRARS